MRFFDLRTDAPVPAIPSASLLCVGNFDGVHLGHRQLVARTLDEVAARRSAFPREEIASGVWLFESASYKTSDVLCTLEEKLEVFASLGLEYAAVAEFREMRELSPEDFVHDVLRGECHCVGAVCGENFRFGKNAAGDAARLCELMYGAATVVPLLSLGGETVSSSRIRNLLLSGDIVRANELLGGRYSICEPVVHGKELGRTLGIPTINQHPTKKRLLLPDGVYSTLCTLDGKEYLGVTDVGVRPTTDRDGEKSVETFLIGYSGDCYGETVRVEFLERIRDEKKFSDLDELSAQIRRDIDRTRDTFEKR